MTHTLEQTKRAADLQQQIEDERLIAAFLDAVVSLPKEIALVLLHSLQEKGAPLVSFFARLGKRERQ